MSGGVTATERTKGFDFFFTQVDDIRTYLIQMEEALESMIGPEYNAGPKNPTPSPNHSSLIWGLQDELSGIKERARRIADRMKEIVPGPPGPGR